MQEVTGVRTETNTEPQSSLHIENLEDFLKNIQNIPLVQNSQPEKKQKKPCTPQKLEQLRKARESRSLKKKQKIEHGNLTEQTQHQFTNKVPVQISPQTITQPVQVENNQLQSHRNADVTLTVLTPSETVKKVINSTVSDIFKLTLVGICIAFLAKVAPDKIKRDA